MDAIRATWKDGQVVLEDPVDWPDGSRLLIEPDLSQGCSGLTEDADSMTSEEIVNALLAMDKVEPLDMSADETADLERLLGNEPAYAL